MITMSHKVAFYHRARDTNKKEDTQPHGGMSHEYPPQRNSGLPAERNSTNLHVQLLETTVGQTVRQAIRK